MGAVLLPVPVAYVDRRFVALVFLRAAAAVATGRVLLLFAADDGVVAGAGAPLKAGSDGRRCLTLVRDADEGGLDGGLLPEDLLDEALRAGVACCPTAAALLDDDGG